MKYCCKEFEQIHNDAVYSSIFSPKSNGEWMIMIRPEFDCGACDWTPLWFCPFCGHNLADKFAGEKKYPQDENMD